MHMSMSMSMRTCPTWTCTHALCIMVPSPAAEAVGEMQAWHGLPTGKRRVQQRGEDVVA